MGTIMADQSMMPIQRSGATRRQRGVVLFIALIALVAMSLAGLALIRSVGSGLLVAGNLGFKRNATSAADYGIEAGRKWFTDQTASATPIDLNNPSPTLGYYADWASFDPATATWADSNSVKVPDADIPQAVNEVRYVIHRMCSRIGAAVPEECATARGLGGSSTKVGAKTPLSAAGSVYYRVTARVVGTKGTVSLVQTVMF
jgi:type IV pilus assembly protein PilX